MDSNDDEDLVHQVKHYNDIFHPMPYIRDHLVKPELFQACLLSYPIGFHLKINSQSSIHTLLGFLYSSNHIHLLFQKVKAIPVQYLMN